MDSKQTDSSRRNFIKNSAAFAGAITLIPQSIIACAPNASTTINGNIVGPIEGFTPQLGTLVSMMNWMREVVLRSVRNLSQKELDYIHDKDANSIGAMLWHLAAVERFYQINTFDGKHWQGLNTKDAAKWEYAGDLGSAARKNIKGYNVNFYLDLLKNVRDFTLSELKNRNDDWLMEIDNNFWSSPTNNYCKWFHVCEHESNHNGQIKLIKSRIS